MFLFMTSTSTGFLFVDPRTPAVSELARRQRGRADGGLHPKFRDFGSADATGGLELNHASYSLLRQTLATFSPQFDKMYTQMRGIIFYLDLYLI